MAALSDKFLVGAFAEKRTRVGLRSTCRKSTLLFKLDGMHASLGRISLRMQDSGSTITEEPTNT
jgi:hypothetical protein